jgi:hypothetical protein
MHASFAYHVTRQSSLESFPLLLSLREMTLDSLDDLIPLVDEGVQLFDLSLS